MEFKHVHCLFLQVSESGSLLSSLLSRRLFLSHHISIVSMFFSSVSVCLRRLPPRGTTKAAQRGVWLVESLQRGGDAFRLSGVMLADRAERVTHTQPAEAVPRRSLFTCT